jgi:beta-lactamase regulating signal transducer with metallopeptidase domain
MKILLYILVSSVCLSILYIAFRLIYRNEANFRQMRVFLMGSVLLSLLLPISHYKIPLGNSQSNTVIIGQISNPAKVAGGMTQNTSLNIDWNGVAVDIYLLMAAIFLARILLQLIILAINYIKSKKLKRNDCVLLFNHNFRNTFSFFDWIFISPAKIKKEDLEHIIIHERIHATQLHTLDLIVIELLTAVMWFNPLIWMMKNSIQLVHEYLADEGALNTGIDKHRYQALLINQITEDKLISLSSSFNHSLIKKRMKMMLNKKFNRRSNRRIIALVPLAGFLFVVTAMINSLLPGELYAASLKPLNVRNFKNDSGRLNPSMITPADTIKTKTIKIIHKQGSPDSTITETYDVKVLGDTARGTKIVYYNDQKMNGDTIQVVYIIGKDDPEIMLSEDPDTLGDVLVKSNVMHKEKVIITKNSTTYKSDGGVPSNTLVIIDGVKHTEKDAFSSIDPDKIESVNVIKDKKMMKKYTDKDYEGVIIVTTKAQKK